MRLTMEGVGLRSMKNITLEGQVLVTSKPITLLGFVDMDTGNIVDEKHPLYSQSIKDKIFVFPRGIGSTVAPYVLINLRKNNTAPLAIINRESDSGTVAGASASRIPMVYRLNQDPISVLQTGDIVKISIKNGKAMITRS